MRLDDLPRSDRVEDRRGDGPSPLPIGRGGGIGLGTVLFLCLVGWVLGINPMDLIGGAEVVSNLGASRQETQTVPRQAKLETPSDQMGEFVAAILGSTE